MKTRTKSFVTANQIKLLFTSILMLGASLAYAEPALVVTDFSCTILDGNGGFFTTNDTKVTKANNPGGNAVLKCRAKGVPNSTGETVKWNSENYYGSQCFSSVLGANTDEWKIVVDPDGNAVMTCKFRN